MFFFFTFGTHEFTSPLKDYEAVTAQCQHCGNWTARCVKRWPWFTFCFVPVIPLAMHPYKEVSCTICSFTQDLRNRPDILSQHTHAQNPMPGPGGPGPAPVHPQYK